jgi:hypothetical protein
VEELSAAAGNNINRPVRRLLVSRPSTSRQKAEQQMRVGGAKVPFKQKQAAANLGRRIPRSGWNPIHNRWGICRDNLLPWISVLVGSESFQKL